MKCWDFLPFCLLYIDFILYYLLKVLTISQSFIRYFKSNIISSSNGDNVTFSILSSIQVVYFLNIFALPQISLNIVNKSSESVLSCLIFDFRGNEFSFFPFNVELAIGLFSFVFKINLKHYSFIFTFFQTFFFIIKEHRIFFKASSALYWSIHLVSVLEFVYMCCILLHILNHPWISEMY